MAKYWYKCEMEDSVVAINEEGIWPHGVTAMPEYYEGMAIVLNEEEKDTLIFEGDAPPSITVGVEVIQPVEFVGSRPPGR